MLEVAVEAISLWKGYNGVWALQDVSLRIGRGRLAVIIGPNGAGKSTLLKIICGLVRPTEGRVKVLGLEWRAMELKERVGVLLHEPLLYEELTVLENLTFYSSFYKSRIGEEIIGSLGIHSILDRRIEVLSYGWKRRVDLARALIQDPDLLILDEPFSGVDEKTCRVIGERIVPDMIERGKTVIVASHIERYLDHLPHTRIVLADGVLKQVNEV